MMKYVFAVMILLCSSVAYTAIAASNDMLLNLRNPAASSPLAPTLRVDGPADGGTNPIVKLPTLPCRANAVAPTWAEGSIVPCSVDLAGALRMSGGGGGGGGTSSTFGAAFPITGTAAGYFDGTNMQGARVHDLDSGAGTEYNLGVNLRFNANGGSVEAGTLTNPLRTNEIGASASTVTNVDDTNVNATLLAANANRIGGSIYNDSEAVLRIKLGVTASATSFTAKIFPDGYYEIPNKYLGQIDGIWESDAAGAARITELTP